MASTSTLSISEVVIGGNPQTVIVVGLARASLTEGVWTVSEIVIPVKASGESPVRTALTIDQSNPTKVEVPAKLLVRVGNGYGIRRRDELGQLSEDEFAALEDKARRSLGEPIIVVAVDNKLMSSRMRSRDL